MSALPRPAPQKSIIVHLTQSIELGCYQWKLRLGVTSCKIAAQVLGLHYCICLKTTNVKAMDPAIRDMSVILQRPGEVIRLWTTRNNPIWLHELK